MILARCPHCETTFRAAPEALKLRAGKVRCGKCQQVFNALDHVVTDVPVNAIAAAPAAPASVPVAPIVSAPAFALTPPPAAPSADETPATPAERSEGSKGSEFADAASETSEAAAATETADQAADRPASPEASALPAASVASPIVEADAHVVIESFDGTTGSPSTPPPSLAPSPDAPAAEKSSAAIAGNVETGVAADNSSVGASKSASSVSEMAAESDAKSDVESDTTSAPIADADPLLEAQAAGLVAARDTREAPGYSKWAEGTLSAPSPHFDEPHKTGWMVVVLAVVLGLMLLVQIVHHWRMEIANRWPETRPWLEEACHSFHCTVPYARDIGQINLEASELQIDPERGNMLVLNMTVKNRAPFAQEFPAVELTLTDARDQVVVRRILSPNEWLPANLDSTASAAGKNPVSTPPAFPADKEIAARLWIDAKDTGAVGYRLFVFYP